MTIGKWAALVTIAAGLTYIAFTVWQYKAIKKNQIPVD